MKLLNAYLGFFLYFVSMNLMTTKVVQSITKKYKWLK